MALENGEDDQRQKGKSKGNRRCLSLEIFSQKTHRQPNAGVCLRFSSFPLGTGRHENLSEKFE